MGYVLQVGGNLKPYVGRTGKVLVGRDHKPISYEMPSDFGNHYIVAPNGARWGRLSLILFLTRLSLIWSGRWAYPFGLGDLGNGDLSPVHSHHDHGGGQTVDIYVLNSNGLERYGINGNKTAIGDPYYDERATILLAQTVNELRSEFRISWWYFNEDKKKHPELASANFTYLGNHDDHMHIHLAGTYPSHTESELVDPYPADSLVDESSPPGAGKMAKSNFMGRMF